MNLVELFEYRDRFINDGVCGAMYINEKKDMVQDLEKKNMKGKVGLF